MKFFNHCGGDLLKTKIPGLWNFVYLFKKSLWHFSDVHVEVQMMLKHRRKFGDGPTHNEECVFNIIKKGIDIEVTADKLKVS